MVRALLLVALLLSCSGSLVCLNEEGFLLLAFKDAIRDDPHNVTGNWNSSQETPCTWDGVMCKQGRVVSLSLPMNQLLGSLPSALGSLRSLRHINLRNNRLYGSLPVELFLLVGLQSLVLYANSLSGTLPEEVGEMRYLQNLDLSGNSLSGSIPSSMLNCTRLRTLMLGHNIFVGVLPPGFGASFSDLQTLNLSHNGFEGPIPSEIGSLSNLQGTLDLSYNRFSGPIPSSLGELPENVYIDLTYNNLSGPIPRNGSLDNRGPTAYIGNPGLCGLPLKNRCPGDSPGLPLPTFPRPTFSGVATSSFSRHKKLSTGSIVAIALGDTIGIALVAFLFVACYVRVSSHRRNGDQPNTDKVHKGKQECLCFRKDESETPSENMEQLDLVPLDVQVGFDLDELLRAPAFILGKSEIGIVYKVVLGNGLTLAVRRLGEGGSQRFREFQLEVEAIGRIRHTNIVALRAYYWSDDEKLLIYDYIPNGSLASAIHGKSETPLLWEVRVGIAKGLAKGLAYLHGFSPRKYVHGDLKPINVLLGEKMEPYISDFGLGRLANIAGGSPGLQSNRVPTDNGQQQSSESAANLIVSPRSLYQAPETPKLLKPSQKWDIYSYGVILLELITGKSTELLMSTSEMDIVSWVQLCMDEKKPFSDVVDPVLLRQMQKEEEMIGVFKIALQCVNSNPERRPSMKNVSDLLDRLACIG